MTHLTVKTSPNPKPVKKKRKGRATSPCSEIEEEFKLFVKTTLLICEEGNELNILCQLFQPNPENLNCVYERVYFDLMNELKQAGRWNIEAFGSTVTGMAFKWSDIDFYIENTNKKFNEPSNITLRRVDRILRNSRHFSEVFTIYGARVPIIKCTHNLTGYNLDINASSKFGVYNSKFIANMLAYDERVHSLMLIMKIWASSWNLTKSFLMTNYCLTWMVFFYLQNCKPAILPSVREFQEHINPELVDGVNFAINTNTRIKSLNTQNIKEILAGFFKFYVNYDFGSFVICPYLGKSIPRSQFAQPQDPDPFPQYTRQLEMFQANKNENANLPDFLSKPLNVRTPMVVQDPFLLNLNSSTTVRPRVFAKFKSQIKKGHHIFINAANRPVCSSTLLLQLFYEPAEEEIRPEIAPRILVNTSPKPVKLPVSEKMHQCKFGPVETELIYVRNYLRKAFPNQTFDKNDVNKFWVEKIVEFTAIILQDYFKVTMSSLKKIGAKTKRTVGQSDVHSNKFTINCELSADVDTWSGRKNDIKRGYAAYLKEQMEITNKFQSERTTHQHPTNLRCTLTLSPQSDFTAINITIEDSSQPPNSSCKTFFTEFTIRMRNFYKALFDDLCRT